jgi:hypothetical protein
MTLQAAVVQRTRPDIRQKLISLLSVQPFYPDGDNIASLEKQSIIRNYEKSELVALSKERIDKYQGRRRDKR